MKIRIQTDQAPAAVGPYSQAIKAGDTVYVAMQIPLDPATGQLVTGDMAAQTHQVMQNIAAILASAGASWSHVVKTTVYLIDMADFAAMNAVYAEFVADDPPARAALAAHALPRGAAVAMDAVAVLN
ncbi:MAG: Rid family detoxifying hydrolase [Chloroflexi bacterium]|nr:Rid family detoxifying hydrolase [Chloroflexota bacterium]MBU1748438.1 Rid family detoxifying hydrolase [Chloroflexota bacterium]MBU1877727.1 Rid family detoxifying hydrolase [Chloroflexota bacterium]